MVILSVRLSSYRLRISTTQNACIIQRIQLIISIAEFPKKASTDDIDENDMIKVLANSSIQYSACSSFAALSGNTEFQLHPSSQRTDDQSEDEVNSDEDECEEEPLKYLLTVKNDPLVCHVWVSLFGGSF